MKKKVAATKMIAAAERTRISVVAFEVLDSDFAGCFGLDGGAVALAGGAARSTAGSRAGLVAGTCGFADFGLTSSGDLMTLWTLAGGIVGDETLLCGPSAGGTSIGGIGVVGTGSDFT